MGIKTNLAHTRSPMRFRFTLFFILLTSSLFASDHTELYKSLYDKKITLNPEDFHDTEIVLIPGIVSETFIRSDRRSTLDFSIFFKDYFGSQLEYYKKLGFAVSRLPGSSRSVRETILQIEEKTSELRSKGIRPLFVTHSLGGLALLEWLVKQNIRELEKIKGIVFLQSPFRGSPIANIYFENPYYARTFLGPILTFFNASEETVRYLTEEERMKFMTKNEQRIRKILSLIPSISASGLSLYGSSIFRPSLNVIGYGCLTYIWGACRSEIIYQGPYDDSDGMIPFRNSHIRNLDFVQIMNVDHGETVLKMPFSNLDKTTMTNALIHIILNKSNDFPITLER